jgi:hypothetical protein
MRVFAVLAAALLIGALAIATMAPANIDLGQFVATLDRAFLSTVQAGIQRYIAPWVWDDVIVPILRRPAWLFPAELGIVCAGLAATFALRSSAPQSRRRRS